MTCDNHTAVRRRRQHTIPVCHNRRRRKSDPRTDYKRLRHLRHNKCKIIWDLPLSPSQISPIAYGGKISKIYFGATEHRLVLTYFLHLMAAVGEWEWFQCEHDGRQRPASMI